MADGEIIKFLTNNLRIIGISPETNRNFLLISLLGIPPVITWALGIYQLTRDDLDFKRFANAVETVIATTHCNVKYLIFLCQYNEIKLLLNQLKHLIAISDFNGTLEQLCNTEFRKIKLLRNAYAGLGVACTVIPCFKLTLLDELVFDCYVPHRIPITVIKVINGGTVISAALLPVSFDIFSFIIISLIRVPIKMINTRLATFGIGDDDNDAYNAEILQRLKNWVKSHQLFYDCLNSVNSVVGWGVLVQFLLFIGTVCFELFFTVRAQSLVDLIQSLIYVLTMMFELLICYCWPADDLKEEASNTTFYVYDTKWYNCSSVAIKKILLIVMIRAQKDAVISCRNMCVVNLETCTNAFKASLSYFSTLQAMEQKYSN